MSLIWYVNELLSWSLLLYEFAPNAFFPLVLNTLKVDGLIRLMEGDNTGPINIGNPGECDIIRFVFDECKHTLMNSNGRQWSDNFVILFANQKSRSIGTCVLHSLNKSRYHAQAKFQF